jgi:hypothetical protein
MNSAERKLNDQLAKDIKVREEARREKVRKVFQAVEDGKHPREA